ncbi:d-isomer specific 2-hydroxyacid dehydrogenase [Purpureocillium lavendulum]|uniref:D-isomer specific 2-hydroxyacid dehydrogenase n=1 Tax=Purpureocillium lavendulum TaxID=1247861 RepID=A0AB34FUF4_9HYPO|nr:d-isomer specific 2-hydroxyacid dehydrogenase [Purpureocillium lavendulum]
MATKIAVLDDYQGCAKQFYDKLDPAKFAVSYFPDTLLPYKVAPREVQDELVRRLEPFDVISSMRERTPFPAELLQRLPNLKLLLTSGVRNKAIDLPACAARGIPVAGATDTHAGPTDSTTEHAVAMILGLARGLAANDAAVKAGQWQSSGFATGLGGRVFGVLGLGRLGAAVARVMHLALGMRVVAWSANLTQDAADDQARRAGLPVEGPDGVKTFRAVSREELFGTADVVSVHLVLSDRTRGIVGAQDLARMKPTAFFVNTSRGPLVVERDLLDVLKAGRIRGAALDVFDLEPLPLDSEWRDAQWGKNGTSQVLVTPHMGYVEETSIAGFYRKQVANLERWVAGESLETLLT